MKTWDINKHSVILRDEFEVYEVYYGEKMENMDDKVIEKICSIAISENNCKQLYDCEGNKIEKTARYTRTINLRYRNIRKEKNLHDEKLSVVWILVGISKGKEGKILQVGRNCSLTRMLSSDIRKDVKEILEGVSNSKYCKLCNTYEELVFFEVNIEKYLSKDNVFQQLFGEISLAKMENFHLYSLYQTIRASYVEGKIAAMGRCKKENIKDEKNMWCPSPGGIDGSVCDYWLEKSNIV